MKNDRKKKQQAKRSKSEGEKPTLKPLGNLRQITSFSSY